MPVACHDRPGHSDVVLKTIEGDFNLSMIHLTAATSGSI
jgi:hypothetical protein